MASILCYLTGLSPVDPIRTRLKLGRFLNKELSSVPDIDLDFPREIREELIREVHRRYGEEHVAMVATFFAQSGSVAQSTFMPRSVGPWK